MGTCKNERKTLLTKPFCLVLLDKNLRHNTDCKSLHPPGSVLTCEAPTEVSQWDCHCEIYRQNLNVVWIHLNFYFYVVINSQVLTRNHRPHALLLILLQWWQPANLYYSITTSILTWTVPTPFVSLFVFYIFSYLLLKTMGCFSGCLMSSASIQKLFCGIYSVFKCSFDEFVGEKVVSLSYSSAILGPPSACFQIIEIQHKLA